MGFRMVMLLRITKDLWFMVDIVKNHRLEPVKPVATKSQKGGVLGVIGFAYKREKKQVKRISWERARYKTRGMISLAYI